MQLYDINLASRLLLVTAQYPSPQVLTDAISASGCGVITGLLRREIAGARGANGFWPLLQATGARILPNTAGCHSAREAITTAQMAREVFGTNWIKLEVIGNADTLQPDPFALVEAARVLCADGFAVFPYTTEDLIVAERLLGAGCRVLMPWGAPIGSGRGLRHVNALASMRGHFPGAARCRDLHPVRPVLCGGQAADLGLGHRAGRLCRRLLWGDPQLPRRVPRSACAGGKLCQRRGVGASRGSLGCRAGTDGTVGADRDGAKPAGPDGHAGYGKLALWRVRF